MNGPSKEALAAWEAHAQSEGLDTSPGMYGHYLSPVTEAAHAGFDAGRKSFADGLVPDGYAVVMADGHFVGIWQTEGAAKLMCGRDKRSKGETIRPMVYALPKED